MDKLHELMRDRGLSSSDIKDWMMDEYAPVSDSISIGMLTPTMIQNIIQDIKGGKLEHLEG